MKLDHVVYFTNKTVTEIVDQQQKRGNAAIVGGRHEQWGTANALLYTENAYIEWLTVEDACQAKKAAACQPLIAQFLHDQSSGDDWATVCFSVDDMEQWKEELDNKGFQTTSILEASRKTAEGQMLRWKMLFVEQEVTTELPYPFFIEWEDREDVRFARLNEMNARTATHTQQKITECIFHVDDPLRETAEWAILLSQKVGDANDIRVGEVVLRFIEIPVELERLAAVRFSHDG